MSNVTVPNGNICLTFDESVSHHITKFAAKYFADRADGYLLGPQSLPHVTLCQIHHDRPQPRALRRELGAVTVQPDTITLANLNVRAGSGAHDGYTWLEFSLAPTPQWLAALKAQVETVLQAYDITILTPPLPDYHPHLTLCRFRAPGKPIVTDATKFHTSIDPAQISLSLGASDANGQFEKIYWTRKLT